MQLQVMSKDDLKKMHRVGMVSDEQIEEHYGVDVLKELYDAWQHDLYLGTHYA